MKELTRKRGATDDGKIRFETRGSEGTPAFHELTRRVRIIHRNQTSERPSTLPQSRNNTACIFPRSNRFTAMVFRPSENCSWNRLKQSFMKVFSPLRRRRSSSTHVIHSSEPALQQQASSLHLFLPKVFSSLLPAGLPPGVGRALRENWASVDAPSIFHDRKSIASFDRDAVPHTTPGSDLQRLRLMASFTTADSYGDSVASGSNAFYSLAEA